MELNPQMSSRMVALLQTLELSGCEVSPSHQKALSQLSSEHDSGISLAQLSSPMMVQFRKAKEEVPEAILFFRMGDFYEFFGLDAIIASAICGLTLTSRDKNSSQPVPMAGVPVSGCRAALRKCVKAGFKAAVCDQMEDPKSVKSLVRREIIRICTPAMPGDIFDEDWDSKTSVGCYLASCVVGKNAFTFAFVDASTGDLRITHSLTKSQLEDEILTADPKEILCSPELVAPLKEFLIRLHGKTVMVKAIDSWILSSGSACKTLFESFFPGNLFQVFGLESVPLAYSSIGALLDYIKQSQRACIKNLTQVRIYDLSHSLKLDQATKRHLDLFVTSSGEKKGSIFWLLNHCMTPMGSRALYQNLHYPFLKREEIVARQEQVEFLVVSESTGLTLRNALQGCMDFERFLSRAAQYSVDARLLVWFHKSLGALLGWTQDLDSSGLPPVWKTLVASLEKHLNALCDIQLQLSEALVDEPAPILGKGPRTFKEGYCTELDELIGLEFGLEQTLQNLEEAERKKSGISTLKIGFARNMGYFFEVSKGKSGAMPGHFEKKQTLTNADRFVTDELKKLESKVLTASDKRMALEKQYFQVLVEKILTRSELLGKLAEVVAKMDLIGSLAFVANQNGWCKPYICESRVTFVENSMHPVLQKILPSHQSFVPNSFLVGDLLEVEKDRLGSLDESLGSGAPIHLITGPNMAGKSTLMRQVALTQILAQLGSYVPGTRAVVGVCDAVYSRIGSADNALKNQSTFMVEMLETAQILHLATPQSLLLLDEVGRGTSTFDGLALAWSILEELADRLKARTLFSTHYHELREVAESRSQIQLMQMEVIETSSQEILFSRRYVPGAAGKSFGIQVAKLAGIPDKVTNRAQEILAQKEVKSKSHTNSDDSFVPEKFISDEAGQETLGGKPALEDHPALELLHQVEINHITPLDALNLLALIKDFSKGELSQDFVYDQMFKLTHSKKKRSPKMGATLF